MDNALDDKYDALLQSLRGYGRLAVAYSGGVDSTFLARATRDALGEENTLAVFARSEALAPGDDALARRIAEEHGIPLHVLEHPGLSTPGMASNPVDRCYICKRAVLQRILDAAREAGFETVADGSTDEDVKGGDYRPGMRASKELGVVSPLAEGGWAKADIRAASRALSLENWDRPSEACLATRFPYGASLTEAGLERVAKAEAILHEEGFTQLRVRDHGEVARIEVLPDDIARWSDPVLRHRIVEAIRRVGYAHVALDLEGYRTGSMNVGLDRRTE